MTCHFLGGHSLEYIWRVHQPGRRGTPGGKLRLGEEPFHPFSSLIMTLDLV